MDETGTPELPCFVINLDDRSERWDATRTAFEGTGLRLQRWSATRHKEGWRGCGASHVSVIRAAIERGYSWVLVLEDDCMPSAEFAARWPAIRKALWAERDSWDIFLGGATYVEGPGGQTKSGLIEIDQGFTTHFYVLNAAAFTPALAWQPDRHGPIDVYFSNIYRIVTVKPFIAYQRPGDSDILGRSVDYLQAFKISELGIDKILYQSETRSATVGLLVVSAAALWWLLRRR